MERSEFTHKVAYGVRIVDASTTLLWENPILWLYGALAFVINETLLFSAQGFQYNLVVYVSSVLTTFFALCIAHHAMRLIRYQKVTIRGTFTAIAQRYQQVIPWLLFILLVSRTTLTAFFTEKNHLTAALAFIFIIIRLGTRLAEPIIATEHGSFVRALYRSLYLVWRNLCTYISAMFCMIAFCLLLELPFTILCMIVEHTLPIAWAAPIAHLIITLASILIWPLAIVTWTMFYYEFYVRPELELAEILATRM